MSDKKKPKRQCVLCKKTFSGYGNNPEPLATEGVFCDTCNDDVLAARMVNNNTQIKISNPAIRNQGKDNYLLLQDPIFSKICVSSGAQALTGITAPKVSIDRTVNTIKHEDQCSILPTKRD